MPFMADIFTPAVRSAIMSRIRGRDTAPEKTVRAMAHRMGYRFRLHRRDLPGTPDLVFPRLRRVVFVHGCFWHGHTCGRKPASKTRPDYWEAKITRNQARDTGALRKIRRQGWKPLVVWECETRDLARLQRKLKRFLDEGTNGE